MASFGQLASAQLGLAQLTFARLRASGREQSESWERAKEKI